MSFTLRRSVSFLLVFLFLVSLFPAAVCGEEEVEEVSLDGDFLSEDTTADFTADEDAPGTARDAFIRSITTLGNREKLPPQPKPTASFSGPITRVISMSARISPFIFSARPAAVTAWRSSGRGAEGSQQPAGENAGPMLTATAGRTLPLPTATPLKSPPSSCMTKSFPKRRTSNWPGNS